MWYPRCGIVMNWLTSLGGRKTLIVLTVFLLLNVALYCFSPANSFLELDTKSYLTAANTLIETGSLVSDWRLPGYPLVLAGILTITNHVGAAVVALQVAL